MQNMIGAQVEHPFYGVGRIRETRFGGFSFKVEFEDGSILWLRFNDVKFLGKISSERRSKKTVDHLVPKSSPLNFDGYFEPRKMIEAFRLGIVPFDCIENITCGREIEINQIIDWLNNPQQSILFLVGGYGTGKTHLLNYLYDYLPQKGFVTSYVSIDPQECPFHKPKKIYSEIARTLKYCPSKGASLGDIGCFRDLVRQVIEKGGFKDHMYFSKLISRNDEFVWEWIEAKENPIRPSMSSLINWQRDGGLPGLYSYSTAANIYCHIISGIGYAVKEYLNQNGLLILFDESEFIDQSDTAQQYTKGINLIKAFIQTANDEELLLSNRHLHDLSYSTRAMNATFLYRKPSNLKIIFAVTNRCLIEKVYTKEICKIIELDHLSKSNVNALNEKLLSIYKQAYPEFLLNSKTHTIDLTTISTRMIVKTIVEHFDMIRFEKLECLPQPMI